MKKFYYSILLSIISSGLFSQTDSSKVYATLNFAGLYSGTPELQADYFFSKHIGVSFNTGYVFKPRRGFYKKDDGAEIISLKGYYFKAGGQLKLAFDSFKDWRLPIPFLQLFYIGSFYNENGIPQIDNINNYPLGEEPSVRYKGFVNAVAISSGVYFDLVNDISIKIGMQAAYYNYRQRKHVGAVAQTFQPGIGSPAFIGNNVLILAATFKF